MVLYYSRTTKVWKKLRRSRSYIAAIRYTTKDVVIGAIFFPYAWWAGGSEGYRILTTSSEDRKFEENCLDASEALGLKRKSRLRYCECLVETGKRETCKAKIFIK